MSVMITESWLSVNWTLNAEYCCPAWHSLHGSSNCSTNLCGSKRISVLYASRNALYLLCPLKIPLWGVNFGIWAQN